MAGLEGLQASFRGASLVTWLINEHLPNTQPHKHHQQAVKVYRFAGLSNSKLIPNVRQIMGTCCVYDASRLAELAGFLHALETLYAFLQQCRLSLATRARGYSVSIILRLKGFQREQHLHQSGKMIFSRLDIHREVAS